MGNSLQVDDLADMIIHAGRVHRAMVISVFWEQSAVSIFGTEIDHVDLLEGRPNVDLSNEHPTNRTTSIKYIL